MEKKMKTGWLLLLVIYLISCSSHRNKVVIAHRGAPGYLPEHTLEGVAMAHAWGVDFVEPDVVLTKDNRAVILHDVHIDTTTNVANIYPKRKRQDGRYYAIDFTLKELKTLTVNERIDLRTGKQVFKMRFSLNKSRFEIPTLEEYIELVQGLNQTRNVDVGIYPELKSPEFHLKAKKDIAKIVLSILDRYGYNSEEANIYVQCFYPPTLRRLRNKLGAKMPLIALIAENSWNETSFDYEKFKDEESLTEISKYIDGIGPYIPQLYTKKNNEISPSALVMNAKKLNLKIHPYTHRMDQLPPEFKSSQELFDFLYDEAKVDGIFSDFGDKALIYSKN